MITPKKLCGASANRRTKLTPKHHPFAPLWRLCTRLRQLFLFFDANMADKNSKKG
jgi:hypothetical protein